MSVTNQGNAFEENILTVCSHYAFKRRLCLQKVEPPVRVLGGGSFRRVIFLDNPFLDLIGTWTERGGRLIALEVKSVQAKGEDRIGLGKSGITTRQIAALKNWHAMGAAVGVLVDFRGAVRFYHLGHIAAALAAGWKSLSAKDGWHVPQGQGFILFDFLVPLAHAYYSKEERTPGADGDLDDWARSH